MSWTQRFLVCFFSFMVCSFLICILYGKIWMDQCGEGIEQGDAVLVGPEFGDLLDYKLSLYKITKPKCVVLGSASGALIRSDFFERPFLNMAGTADSLESLRRTVEALLLQERPDCVLIALDFWWFTREQEEKKPVSHSFLARCKAPFRWLGDGTLSLKQFFALITNGFSTKRRGVRAQFFEEGYGPDGSFYPIGTVKGKGNSDLGFRKAIERIHWGLGEFRHQSVLDMGRVEQFADIYFKLRARGVHPVLFLSPIVAPVFAELKTRKEQFPHLFDLQSVLSLRGIDIFFSESGSIENCEFFDATRIGEIASARLLQRLIPYDRKLASYVNQRRITKVLRDWGGQILVPQDWFLDLREEDFLGLGCLRKHY